MVKAAKSVEQPAEPYEFTICHGIPLQALVLTCGEGSGRVLGGSARRFQAQTVGERSATVLKMSLRRLDRVGKVEPVPNGLAKFGEPGLVQRAQNECQSP